MKVLLVENLDAVRLRAKETPMRRLDKMAQGLCKDPKGKLYRDPKAKMAYPFYFFDKCSKQCAGGKGCQKYQEVDLSDWKNWSNER